jgi:hypothetical protein
MDPLDKLELIIKGTISQKKKERERGKDNHSSLYILGLDHDIDTLSWVWTEIESIRRNAPAVSDEIVLKMYAAGK